VLSKYSTCKTFGERVRALSDQTSSGEGLLMSSVFMSYSRKDRDMVTAMVMALRSAGEDVWVDLDDIVPSAVWMEEIKTAIANADSVIFVISPDSVASEVCGVELQYAAGLPKRIVPVVIRETPVSAVPAPLPDINWLFVRQDSFDADVVRLVDTLRTDIDRVHLHTRLLVRATEWSTRGGDKSLLLRGMQLTEAERWLAGQTDQKPTTMPVQGQFIEASRRAATSRQRSSIAGAGIVMVILAMVAAVAIFQWHNATIQRNQAQARFREATGLRLVNEAEGMLADTVARGDTPAFEQLLAARSLTPTPDDGALYSFVVKRSTTRTIIPTPETNSSVVYRPDGRRLASASGDKIRIWNADTGQPIGAPLTGHTSAVSAVAFSPDGHRLASASDDQTIRIWDADTGRPIGVPLTGHTDYVFSVAFSPDGTRLASAGGDHTLRLWPAGASPADLCHKLTANMSHKQWRDWVSPDIGYVSACPGLLIPPG
jgi:hypothetical protein